MAAAQKRLRVMLAALQPVADREGLTFGPVETTGSGHYRMMVTRADGSAFPFTMPYSPSCARAVLNTVKNLKHMAKEKRRAPL